MRSELPESLPTGNVNDTAERTDKTNEGAEEEEEEEPVSLAQQFIKVINIFVSCMS